MSELRLYTFVNFYLSSIQQGIQSAHVIGDMSVDYRDDARIPTYQKAREDYWEWAEHHKTLITLNGGANFDIVEKYKLLSELSNQLRRPAAVGKFHEDEYSLGGVMTACGVIVSEELFNAVPQKTVRYMVAQGQITDVNRFNLDIPGAWYHVVDGKVMNAYLSDEPEARLIELIKSCGLAK